MYFFSANMKLKCSFHVNLIFISLIANEVECLFDSPIAISCMENYSHIFLQFQLYLFYVFLLSFQVSCLFGDNANVYPNLSNSLFYLFIYLFIYFS